MRKQTHDHQIAMPSDLKLVNRQRILDVFRKGEVLTASEVHELTNISRPTVMRALQHFCQVGVMKSMGYGNVSSVGGKKPELFTFGDERKILCISLWPETVTFALCDLVGGIYALTRYEHTLEDDLQQAFDSLSGFVQRYYAEQGISNVQLYGVALNLAGTVDYDELLLRYNAKAPGWGTNIAMESYLRPIFGNEVKLFVDNAGKAVGRAVLLDHPEYQNQRLMTVFSTWGISACMMERGHVLNGKDSIIGEIGHAVISDSADTTCACGKSGCLESMVSLKKIQQMLNEGCDHADEKVTFQSLFDASAQGDERARKVVRYLAHCFATVLHNLSLTYNQDAVVFQGDFALADVFFDECLKKKLAEFRYFPDGKFFSIDYDRRELSQLAARGDAALMQRMYFSSVL